LESISTPETLARPFQDLPTSRIAIEVRTHPRIKCEWKRGDQFQHGI
jgi:hypothetical protein